ncbi:9280_t:CDS:2 [Diversispora eburnea]|uniref:9280_t:CDS:1 n=1 Tax=Diversispora eburnea TaxID=1213867 RepID=A0A9N9C3Q2_9GLOM|nr:9280_t:CDS:2 [Diversispora eburnea]
MTTTISINTSEDLLKRKISMFTGDEILQGEPNEPQHLTQAAPQRKKPGRKPNPASPALRKAQNRAAQRAFRERKERHLRDLENTIQSLRAFQTETVNKFHREREHLQSLITRFEIENNYFKQIVLNFECALNSINGNNEATTKIKNSVMLPSINLTLSSPTSSSIMPSPESGNLSSPVSSPPTTPDSSSSNKSNRQYLIDNNLLINPPINDIKNINFGNLNLSPTRQQSIIGNMGPRALTREEKQLIKLANVMGSTDYSVPLEPILRRTLTPQQKYFLTLPHDPRIDFIPCLHLRSRMIQFQGFYDLYEIIDLLLTKAKCHGDPIDPDSWECPQEFFDRYPYLAIQHCRIKAALYQKYGKLPSNFSEYQFDDDE